MNRSFRLVIIALLFIGAGYYWMNWAKKNSQTGAEPPSGEPKDELVAVGEVAPPFTLNTLDGKTVSLRDYAGKVVILDFWQTSCPHCREAMPRVQRLHDKYASQGVVVLGVNQQEAPSAVKDFITANKYTIPQSLDPGTAAGAYGVSGLPTLLIIDQQGKVAWVQAGDSADMIDRMSEQVETLLGKKPQTAAAGS